MPFKDPTSPEARASQRASGAKHYQANRQYYIDKARRKTDELVAEVKAIKEANPCADCGVSYPSYVMQFDHIGSDKVGHISTMAASGCRRKVMEEIAKCELVCANCHCIRTHDRRVISR